MRLTARPASGRGQGNGWPSLGVESEDKQRTVIETQHPAVIDTYSAMSRHQMWRGTGRAVEGVLGSLAKAPLGANEEAFLACGAARPDEQTMWTWEPTHKRDAGSGIATHRGKDRAVLWFVLRGRVEEQQGGRRVACHREKERRCVKRRTWVVRAEKAAMFCRRNGERRLGTRKSMFLWRKKAKAHGLEGVGKRAPPRRAQTRGTKTGLCHWTVRTWVQERCWAIRTQLRRNDEGLRRQYAVYVTGEARSSGGIVGRSVQVRRKAAGRQTANVRANRRCRDLYAEKAGAC
ncbi:hypothetical protein ERJ75_000560200 [Trypanosoma vivax]|uniref:Uncharacterized protein n=1 Tax=Trypanosoma vivax (strain Y486) TaxID=1055687 RepID=F9WUL0_TRYVY|nr:hypothetical protein ERJ75_000560200 [Trypanosoma vivax]CCD21259.1 hypothetical protein TvY486_0003590 [Trypanosoma vivax Y486]|eukprot:CCD21259.1 hypothetical protein TvY486_0003590 [Trypanosoma vivax Y486]